FEVGGGTEDGLGDLKITGGGHVVDDSAVIGSATGGTGKVTVDGNQSVWDTLHSLNAANFNGGELDITNGGKVNVGGNAAFGHSSTARIDGAASTLATVGQIKVGEAFTGPSAGVLNISNGGVVSDASAVVVNSGT